MAEIGNAMATQGLSKNNVAHAYAVYWTDAWQAAHGDTATKSASVYQAVAQQAANGIAATPDFANLNDAQKQEFAEALMVQAALIGSSAQQLASDPAKLRQLGVSVRAGAKQMGLDLDAMTLTEDGFVPAKKGSDAGAAVDAANPVAADKALASAEGAGADSGGLSPLHYALIAAAAGAGLGGVFLLGKAAGRRS